jgi:DNA-binding MarR family transcriptional regulator
MMSADEFERTALTRVREVYPGADEMVARFGIGLARVSARLTADYESTVHRPLGLTWPGFRLLFCLWSAGPLQTRELARLLATTAPTVSSVLNTLERKLLVSRERLAHDQRLVQVTLTDAGAAVVAEAFRRQHQREREWLESVSEVELRALVHGLELLATRHRPVPSSDAG